MRIGIFITLTLCALCLGVVGCQRAMPTLADSAAASENADQEFNELFAAAHTSANYPAPASLVDISFGDRALRFWPYTGSNFSGEPTGAPMQAEVREIHSGYMVGERWEAIGSKYQKLGTSDDPNGGKLFNRLVVRSSGVNGFHEEIRCYDSDWRLVASKPEAAGLTGAACRTF